MAQSYREKINVENAKYLLSLSDEQLEKNVGGKEWKGDKPLYNDKAVYVGQVKAWLKKAVAEMTSNDYIKTTYKYSKGLQSVGRSYVEKFGVQKLTKELRGFLIKDCCKDVDMSNAQPTILYHILETFFPDQVNEFPRLKSYVKKRKKWLTEYGCEKKQIFVCMNDSKKTKSNNQYLVALDTEFKQIQRLLWDEFLPLCPEMPKTVIAQKEGYKQNKLGRFINVILCMFEDKILKQTMAEFQEHEVHTPMYDGFTVDAEAYEDEELLEKVNKITENMGITWAIKSHDESIEIDEDVEVDFTPQKTYKEMKVDFEEENFMIMAPLMYVKKYTIEGDEKYQYYSKDKFREATCEYEYFDPLTGKSKDFFSAWRKDPNRLCYKEVRFVPELKEHAEYFNSFSGFTYDTGGDATFETPKDKTRVVGIFKKHLDHLTNYDDESSTYLLNFIAHLIQKPMELPKMAVILKSRQGYGKDTLIDIISALIGKKYMTRTANLDDVFGNYNDCLKDRVVLQLNEVEGSKGFANEQGLKNLITEDDTNLKEKYVGHITQPNYLRVFVLSNNLNPIKIAGDDRRFVVFKANCKKPSKEYFTILHALKNSSDDCQILYNYLNTLDISEFSPTTPVITDSYISMKNTNINPLYKYMFNTFVKEGEQFKNEFKIGRECHTKSSKHLVFIQTRPLVANFECYLTQNGLEKKREQYTLPKIKQFLEDIGVINKQVKLEGRNNNFYVINTEELKDELECLGIEEEEDIEELTLDYFDDVDNFEDSEGETDEEDE